LAITRVQGDPRKLWKLRLKELVDKAPETYQSMFRKTYPNGMDGLTTSQLKSAIILFERVTK
jgi:hypothetical protein